jgi:exonuclease V gamma subunit
MSTNFLCNRQFDKLPTETVKSSFINALFNRKNYIPLRKIMLNVYKVLKSLVDTLTGDFNNLSQNTFIVKQLEIYLYFINLLINEAENNYKQITLDNEKSDRIVTKKVKKKILNFINDHHYLLLINRNLLKRKIKNWIGIGKIKRETSLLYYRIY